MQTKQTIPGGFPFNKKEIPLVAVPLTATTVEELLLQIQNATTHQPDLLEWRADYFPKSQWDAGLNALKETLQIPVLVTLRTAREGGLFEGKDDEYQSFCEKAVTSGVPSLLDVELSMGRTKSKEIADFARQHGVGSVFSCHDFEKTLSKEQLLATFTQMQTLGADIAKVAMMPRSNADVLTLMEACLEFSCSSSIWSVAMSMGEIGKISRVAGQLYGSAITFATVDAPSAPGQIEISVLRSMLEQLQF